VEMMIIFSLLSLLMLAEQPAESPSFETDVIPVLSKAGCNSGACHGAATGRGDFRLSLFGADPQSDYDMIVHAMEGRRINRRDAAISLLLQKPSEQVSHGGSRVLEEDSDDFQLLETWIRSGARRGISRKVTRLAVTTTEHNASNVGGGGTYLLTTTLAARIPFRVTAEFSDGSSEDVTKRTVFTSTDPTAVLMEDNTAEIMRRGQHVVIARFLNQMIPIQFLVPISDQVVDLDSRSRNNFIDDHVVNLLTKLNIPASAQATDAEWLRRVTLDLTGRLPDPTEATAFLTDSTTDKRERVVDALLQTEGYGDLWTLRLSHLLRLHSLPNEPRLVSAGSTWLKQQLMNNVGWDSIARDVLTATGDSQDTGPAGFSRMARDARDHAELAASAFIGVKLGCANCHNHPLDRWTQDDYHGFAAIFARVDRSQNVRILSRGAVTNLRTGEPAIPRIPGVRFLDERELSYDYRLAAATWLTKDDQQLFAKAIVNRLWQAMFGRGLVEPVDDLRDTNPASHPELLNRLASEFITHNFSLKHMLKQMALSQTYSASRETVPGNEQDDRFYSHAFHRPLLPEVLFDAIADVTDVHGDISSQLVSSRAVTLVDPFTPFPAVDVLGRCSKAEDCGETAANTTTLSAQLHLLNGELLNSRIAHPDGRLRRLISNGHSDRDIVAEFYRVAWATPPADEQLERWLKQLQSDDPQERQHRLEDFVWGLLCSHQFQSNH
jgi:hypothetical protein